MRLPIVPHAQRRAGPAVLAAIVALAAACSSHAAQRRPPSPVPSPTPRATASPAPTLSPAGPLHFKVATVAGGLQVPWSMAFLPGGAMLVTERGGRVRLISNGQLQPQPVLTLSVVSAPGVESGLLGIALHPAYPNPPDVYLYY